MTFLQAHNRAFRAEALKLKHSGMFWLCFGAALFIPLLNTIVSFFIDVANGAEVDRWDMFLAANFRGFTSFFFPIFLVLMTVRLVYLEHRSDTWKLLETQPIPKPALFLAKWEIAAFISLLCLIGLFVFALLGGFLLQVAKPEYGFAKYDINWGEALGAILRFWISSFAIISVQYLLGLLVKNFAWPMGIGLMAVIAGSIFAGFGVLTWWPYSFTVLTAMSHKGSAAGNFLLHHEKLSLLWTALMLWGGYQYFTQKSLARAYFLPARKSVFFGMAVLGFSVLVWVISRPNTVSAYHTTVIAGHIKTKKPVRNVLVLQGPAADTILSLPVVNGAFHGKITSSLQPGLYSIRADNYRSEFFFGANDSLFFDVDVTEKGSKGKITGTRIAENEFLQKEEGNSLWMLTDNAYNLKPGGYALQVMNEWKSGVKKLEDFKTSDNIKPREDFVSLQKKLLATKLLDLTDHYYPRVHAVYYPNEKLKYPKSIEGLRKEVRLSDSSLASFPQFRSYLATSLRTRSNRNDSLYLAALSGMPGGVTKDYMLYEAVQNEVFRVKDSTKRARLFRQGIASISAPGLQATLRAKEASLQRIGRGRRAPNFSAEAINEASFDLTKLTNRFVVIDVWATWCVPCIREAPFFEELADKYTSEQVAFVSVSIDENKNAWRMAAAGNKARVLQLWAKNADEDFTRAFAINTIPRYLLIDPKGNIIDADLPPPSDPAFEATLLREISFLSNRSF